MTVNLTFNDALHSPINQSTTSMDCIERNIFFNNIFTAVNLTNAVSLLLIGFLADQFGMVVGRSIGAAFSFSGFICMTLIMYDRSYENILVIAWPLLSVGGLTSKLQNIRSCRCMPMISVTLMSIMSGCGIAGGSTVFLIKTIHEELNIEYYIQFAGLTVLFAVLALSKIVFWTPLFMPNKPIAFSLFESSWVMQKIRKKQNGHEIQRRVGRTRDDNPRLGANREEQNLTVQPKLVDLFKSWPIYVVIPCMAIWQLRRMTHSSWLGSGWPEWVAGPGKAEEFDTEINKFQSICYLTMIAFNLIPGFLVDLCKKYFGKPNNQYRGHGIGFLISFSVTAVAMLAHR